MHAWEEAHGRVQGVVGRWIGIEEAVENRLKSIISPSESLTPGLLYVGVATLTGSILSRTRGLPTRLLLPPSLFLLSLHHFLPSTTQNVTAYLMLLEEKYLPRVAEKHAIALAHTRMTWEGAKETIGEGREQFKGAVEGTVGRMQVATGLKLREGFGWGGEPAKEAKGMRTMGRKVAEEVGEVKQVVAQQTNEANSHNT